MVVGTQKKAPTSSLIKPAQGQVVQIRFRVLNNVSEDGSRPIYDLMNPVIRYKDEATVNEQAEHTKKVAKVRKPSCLEERNAFMEYVNELFENTSENKTVHEITRRESDAYEERSADESLTNDKSCSQVVSRITHRSRKGNQFGWRLTSAKTKCLLIAMYDIVKNNQRVAKLHLIKTAHRLGEPVIGVLDFSDAVLSTYKVNMLECI